MKISQKAAQALDESILHWKDNVKRAKTKEHLKLGADNCALCAIYNKQALGTGYDCSKACPVRKWTGKDFCNGSPYIRVIKSFSYSARTAAAIDMHNFLINIRNNCTIKTKEKHHEHS